MTIIIKKGDITQERCDAIVNPANSLGFMGGGVAGAIKKIGGKEIEDEAIRKSPIELGKAIYTSGGNLPTKYVIHAPTMRRPAMRIGVQNLELATKAALNLGKILGIKSIAIPGMGTGVGGIPYKIAAKRIITLIKKYEEHFEKIILIDRNQEIIDYFDFYLSTSE